MKRILTIMIMMGLSMVLFGACQGPVRPNKKVIVIKNNSKPKNANYKKGQKKKETKVIIIKKK